MKKEIIKWIQSFKTFDDAWSNRLSLKVTKEVADLFSNKYGRPDKDGYPTISQKEAFKTFYDEFKIL